MATIKLEKITIDKTVSTDDTVVYTAHYQNEEIGCLRAALYPNAADLEDIFVHPNYRGNQVASALFRSFMCDVEEKNVKEVTAAISNERSAHLMTTILAAELLFDHEGEYLPGYSIERLIARLKEVRKKEQERLKNMRDDDKVMTLAVRVTAKLK